MPRSRAPASTAVAAGLNSFRAAGLRFKPACGPMGVGLKDVSALAVRPHAAPPPMGTWPEEQGQELRD